MDPISNVDQLVLLLRQRLEARTAGSRSSKSGKANGPKSPARDALGAGAVAALAAVDNVDDRQFHRALIQNILVEKFGAHLVNEAQFQQVVDQVSAYLETDEEASRLLARVTGDLRAAARK